MKKRNLEIDILRGIAMITVILIHTSYYFINDKTALFLWRWSQFAVPVFIFCSAYIFFQNTKQLNFEYLKKRIFRLLKPYYIFLLFFFPVIYFVNPQILNLNYIFQSLLTIGGVDVSWLVLLFMYLTIIFPLISLCFEKNKYLFWAYSFLSFASSILLIFYKLTFSYKLIFWLPWSIVALFALFFVKFEARSKILKITSFICGIIFVSFYFLLSRINHNLGFIENKYPPNIYFLSYGLFSIMILYFLSKIIIPNKRTTSMISFFSKNSYPIFFIHYIFLILFSPYLKTLNLNWFTFFSSILLITSIVQLGINKLGNQNPQSKLAKP
ncbi:MAG TPA: acyltransferase [Candidatus Saccharimonadales bacterium]|nr:acyltransferase [Candidatus Saccharimonadales bacterium]